MLSLRTSFSEFSSDYRYLEQFKYFKVTQKGTKHLMGKPTEKESLKMKHDSYFEKEEK